VAQTEPGFFENGNTKRDMREFAELVSQDRWDEAERLARSIGSSWETRNGCGFSLYVIEDFANGHQRENS